MNTPLLDIRNLHVSLEGKPILKGLDLTIEKGEIHAIMGPNGSGKSTLANVIAGKPEYEITDGDIRFEGRSIVEMEPHERAQAGIFLAFQYPMELPGVSQIQFLRTAINSIREARDEPPLSVREFMTQLNQYAELLKMNPELLRRAVNEGFSGGERKRNEILQLLMLAPRLAILDETDSGLDIDALRIVADGVNHFMHPERAVLLITHYQRLLDYIKPHRVHVLSDGRIVRSGGPELALELEKEGYGWLSQTPA